MFQGTKMTCMFNIKKLYFSAQLSPLDSVFANLSDQSNLVGVATLSKRIYCD